MNNYIEDFNRYSHIVLDKLSKTYPELIDDEDFVQDIYLELLKYIMESESYNNADNRTSKTKLIHIKISHTIEKFLKAKHSSKFESQQALDDICIIDFENYVLNGFSKNAIDRVLSTLTSVEEKIIRMRFYENMSRNKIATELGLSAERLRQKEMKAMRKLRHPSRYKLLQGFYGIQ